MSRFADFALRAYKKIMPDLVGYSKDKFWHDLGAGVTVGVVALPLSLALAIATGVPPIVGLYTAGVAGLLAALFSGSAYSVSGPAAAMVPILAAIIDKHGLTELPYLTLVASLFLIFFAVIRIGRLIRKVPESVVLGFTFGVAVVLFFGQLNSFLGLKGITAHETFAGKVFDTITHLSTVSLSAVVVGLLTLLIIIFWHRLPGRTAKIPATLIAITVATFLSVFLLPVPTLGSTYGQFAAGLPGFMINFAPSHLLHAELWFPAFEIAALIAVESLLCAVVADKLTRTKHHSNTELLAQGAANIGSALFGGMPATAVIARTGTNIKSGARTRLASLIHAVVVLIFIAALTPLVMHIPLAALSAVLIVTSYKIAEVKEIAHFVKNKSLRLSTVLTVTILLTIFSDLVVGVSVGLILHFVLEFHQKLRSSRDQDGPLSLSEEEA